MSYIGIFTRYDNNIKRKENIMKQDLLFIGIGFAGCKITHYKNGNLNIQFSNAKLFSDFEDNFNKALKIAVENSRKGIE